MNDLKDGKKHQLEYLYIEKYLNKNCCDIQTQRFLRMYSIWFIKIRAGAVQVSVSLVGSISVQIATIYFSYDSILNRPVLMFLIKKVDTYLHFVDSYT